MLDKFKDKVRTLKKDSIVLYYAYSDKRLPLWKKWFIACVIGYLFSPLDLIPDFIPVIGFLDDLIIVPSGIYISLKLIPEDILISAKRKAEENKENKFPIGYKTALLIILVWIISLFILFYWLIFLVFHLQI